MTATKHITIWCDFTDCVEWIDHGESTVEETRRLARLEGWVRRRVGMGYQDLCRKHRETTG